MRPVFLTFLLGPLIRHPSSNHLTHARRIPSIEYPICRRSFTSINSPETTSIRMSNLHVEDCVTAEVEAAKKKDSDISAAPEPVKLPQLSPADYKVYNSMAVVMDQYHNHFRQTWQLLYSACVANKRPLSLSLKQFINTGIQFTTHLGNHHAIEEQYFFPLLGAKMPEFKQGKNAAELLQQHKAIHKGMDGFEDYLKRCRSGETELELRVLKEQMDSWGDILWKHLDQEVKTLGAENMRKYWTLEEMRRMPS